MNIVFPIYILYTKKKTLVKPIYQDFYIYIYIYL